VEQLEAIHDQSDANDDNMRVVPLDIVGGGGRVSWPRPRIEAEAADARPLEQPLWPSSRHPPLVVASRSRWLSGREWRQLNITRIE
jgi:hypothetical protein